MCSSLKICDKMSSKQEQKIIILFWNMLHIHIKLTWRNNTDIFYVGQMSHLLTNKNIEGQDWT